MNVITERPARSFNGVPFLIAAIALLIIGVVLFVFGGNDENLALILLGVVGIRLSHG